MARPTTRSVHVIPLYWHRWLFLCSTRQTPKSNRRRSLQIFVLSVRVNHVVYRLRSCYSHHHENDFIFPTWWLLYLHIYTSLSLTHTVQYSTNSLCLLVSVFCLLLLSSPTHSYPGISQSSISEVHYYPIVLVCIVTGHLSFFFISHLSF